MVLVSLPIIPQTFSLIGIRWLKAIYPSFWRCLKLFRGHKTGMITFSLKEGTVASVNSSCSDFIGDGDARLTMKYSLSDKCLHMHLCTCFNYTSCIQTSVWAVVRCLEKLVPSQLWCHQKCIKENQIADSLQMLSAKSLLPAELPTDINVVP